MSGKLKRAYNEYPNSFKVLTLATFIDTLGRFLLFPFFAIYITEHFNVGLIEVGLLFSIFSAGNIIGGVIGGALADKYGRRKIILFGLVVSGISSISMGLVNDLYVFYILASVLGLIGNFGGPARQAMVSDLLPKEKRAEGFGILRVALNVSAVIGPIFGGMLATRSYMLLFIADAVSSIITGIIVFIVIPETKPQSLDNKPEESVFKTIIGYKEVLKDGLFLLFLSVSAITVLVYMQLNSTLSVFLWEVHSFPVETFGWLLSMNAVMVVIFQFWITKKLSKYAPMKMMALGTLFYMVGFGMYGFISEPYMFFIAMGILTIGEMIVIPVSQSAVASFAPEDKRGRYMAVFGLHWAIPNLFGVILAGLVSEIFGANWVWYLAGILCLIAVLGFWVLHGIAKDRFSSKMQLEEIQKKEEKEIHELIA
ncbi:MAG: MDR family MFS transporter [Candidatus Heimdallarchaeota archaeon]